MQSVGPLDFTQRLADRLTGPFSARFILQPLVAIILGIRDGVPDAKLGKPPFVVALLFARKGAIPRAELLKTFLRRILLPLAVGVVLDMIAQWLLFDRVRLWSAVLVGATLVGLPYAAARGLTNRFVTNRNKRRHVASEASKPRRVA